MKNETGGKAELRPFLVFLGVFSLAIFAIFQIGFFLMPSMDQVLSRMERRDPERAQEIMDSYAEELSSKELEAVVTAAELLEPYAWYAYRLNFDPGDAHYEKTLQELPQELVDALRAMEESFPESEMSFGLCTGQVGIEVSYGSHGHSYLCYPGGTYFEFPDRPVTDNVKDVRCLDMGGGWELQMYYCLLG